MPLSTSLLSNRDIMSCDISYNIIICLEIPNVKAEKAKDHPNQKTDFAFKMGWSCLDLYLTVFPIIDEIGSKD
jgi:hypothetical protein